MTKRKASWEEAHIFVCEKLDKHYPDDVCHLQVMVDEIYPFSWGRYCDENKIQTKIRKR
jgi:hypothetical protein